MSAPEDTTSYAGRQPQHRDVDIAALYARLQQEVVRTRRGGLSDTAGLRDIAERTWAVSADRPVVRRPGLEGALLYPVKKLLGPLLRWYVAPLAQEQREFNEAMLQLVDELLERTDPEAGLFAPAVDEPERDGAFVEEFRGAEPVLVVERRAGLVDLFREAGIDARGVAPIDMGQSLERLDDGSLGGVYLDHVAQLMTVPRLMTTLELAQRKLRIGGLLVAETINPLSPLALRRFFADPGNVQPLVPETFASLANGAGFQSVETRFHDAPPRRADVSDDVADILFAPLDYALVARA
jgi:hypothetical protein